MFGDIFRFVLEIVFTLFGAALIVRAWMYAVRLHPFNPVAQAVHQLTNWLVQPLRKALPASQTMDWASLLGAWLAALAYLVLAWLVETQALMPVALLPTTLGVALLTVVKWTLNLVVWLTLIQAVLSWVNPMAPIMAVLQTLTAPLLDPIRRIMPNLGGLDLSPLVLLVLAQIAMMLVGRISFGLLGV